MCKDHFRSKAYVKNKENTMLLTLSHENISIEGGGKKENEKKNKTEYGGEKTKQNLENGFHRALDTQAPEQKCGL